MSVRQDVSDKRHRRGIAASLMLGLIAGYRLTLSALMGRRCRFLPTCSEYSADAIDRYGAWRGFWLALARVSRCHPWGGDGFDPVPDELPDAGWRFWRLGRWRSPK